MRGTKTVTRALAATAAAGAALLGGEALAASIREYLPTEPALALGGVFGAEGDPPLTFAVLGDSTAAGIGAGTPEHAYPTLLAERLAATGRRVHLQCFGISGARAADVLADQLPKAETAHPGLIFVAVGANDVIHLTPVPSFRRTYARLLERLRATAEATGAAVVVAGVPDMRVRAFMEPLRGVTGARGRQLTRVIEAEANHRGIPVVPLARLTERLFTEQPDVAYAGTDDLHPGPAGYEAWADAIAPTLLAALAASGDVSSPDSSSAGRSD